MNKYSEIEIETAQNLLKEGYKWLRANCVGTIFAYEIKPNKNPAKYVPGKIVCTDCVPIFESIKFGDAPTSIESIVHPQILDDAEKRYLSAVIRPFRDRVKHICRVWYITSSSEYQRIYITLSDDSYNIDLPLFKKETMYKGMKIGKAYSLEELGL